MPRDHWAEWLSVARDERRRRLAELSSNGNKSSAPTMPPVGERAAAARREPIAAVEAQPSDQDPAIRVETPADQHNSRESAKLSKKSKKRAAKSTGAAADSENSVKVLKKALDDMWENLISASQSSVKEPEPPPPPSSLITTPDKRPVNAARISAGESPTLAAAKSILSAINDDLRAETAVDVNM